MTDVRVKVQTRYDGRAFDQLRRDSKDTSKSVGTDFSSLGKKIAAGFASVQVIEQASRFTLDFTKTSIIAADRARATERTFENLSGSASEAAENLAAMERATRDLISEQEQQAIANQLLGMRIADTDEELEKVVRVSRRLGKEFRGIGAAEAANEFALMISNMSVARLDTFGISSGKVRERINELMSTTEGMTREEAFFIASMTEAEIVLDRLGAEVETGADKVERLGGSYEDLQTSTGRVLIAFGDVSGGLDTISSGINLATEAINDFADAVEGTSALRDRMFEGQEGLKAVDDAASLALLAVNPLAFATEQLTSVFGNLIFNNDELQKELEETTEDLEDLGDTERGLIELTDEELAHIETLQKERERAAEKEAEEAARAAEKLREIRRDAARQLVRIDEEAQQATDQAWEDFFGQEAKDWQDHQDRIADIRERTAKENQRAEQRLARNLARLDQDENRKVEDIKQQAAKEEQRQEKRRRVDVLADERLFQFELRQMAAEGSANQIREALERREIEEQIAKEKAQVEAEIEDEKLTDQIERVREQSSVRRERLIEDADLERELREERLQEEIDDENEAYAERIEATREFRDEKLAEIEASRNEAIEELGRELAEAQELTESELRELAQTAGKLGVDAGANFAEGMRRGMETIKEVSGLLGEAADFTRPSRAGAGASSGVGFPGFQHGGSFTVGGAGGPDSQLVAFRATPGERVSVGGGSPNITINASGPDVSRLVAILEGKVNDGLQEYTDTVLGPAIE